MKKLFTNYSKAILGTLLFCTLFGFNIVMAGQGIVNSSPAKSNKAAIAAGQNARKGTDNNQTQALFDIQFNYPTVGQVPAGALASVVYTGTEFWVGRWNYDSLFTFSPSGVLTSSFVVAGVGNTTSGVRGMAFDGTTIYAGDNTKIIKKINPSTKALSGTITAATPFTIRGIAWDSTANGGAGGFWVSNFGTGFYLISKTGALLDSIPLSSHGVTSAYSIAFDPYTAGGPYIWAFDQTSTGAAAVLVRVSRTTGLPTITHDTQADIGAGGLAGGLSITWRYSSKKTIVGMQQGTLNLFGYELNDYVQAAIDASADSINFNPPYTQVPIFEETPFNWTVKTSNLGASSINDLSTTFTLNDGSSNVFAPAASHNLNVPANSSLITNNFGPYTPAMGAYTAQAIVTTVGQNDALIANDTARYNMFITDTVMARDNSTATGSLGIGNGTGGTLGQYFDLPNSAYITSVTYLCRNPTAGDATSADIYSFISGSGPINVLASTPQYTFTAADTNGVVLNLPIAGGPFFVGAGSYFIGVNEQVANVTLATTPFNFHPNTGWFIYSTFPWAPVESVHFNVTFLLRMNLVSASDVVEVANEKFGVYPNPASSELILESYQPKPNFKAEIYDLLGNKLMETSQVVAAKTTLDISKLSEGMYLVKTTVGDKYSTTKISIAR